MFVYWLIFLLMAWFAVTRLRPVQSHSARWSGSWHAVFWLLVLVIGLRHEVGGDWGSYLLALEEITNEPLQKVLSNGDLAYNLLNWLAAETELGIYFVNTVCSALFAWGLLAFCRAQPRPWLALVVAVPYLVIVVAMGYTRQGVAIGLAMLGLVALNQGQLYKFTCWLILAALFHKSALIVLPVAAFSGRKKWGALLGVLLVGVLMFMLLLAEHVDFLLAGYIIDEYASSGAGIRVAMNALPAALFLIFRNRFDLTPSQKSFWVWMSLGGLTLILLLAVSPSSTAVDRMALYWIPLQLFVWSRLPQAMGQRAGTQRQWAAMVLVYSFAVQFVWLFYADHNYAWLPYQFYPWVWLWS
jgi:hypothetical protein